jgi:hypothetical protein
MLGIAIGFSDQVGARCRFHDWRLRAKELVDKLVFKKYVLLWRPNLCKMQGRTTLRQQADLWIQIKKRAHKCLTGTNPGRDKPGGAREHILGTENQNFNKYGPADAAIRIFWVLREIYQCCDVPRIYVSESWIKSIELMIEGRETVYQLIPSKLDDASRTQHFYGRN